MSCYRTVVREEYSCTGKKLNTSSTKDKLIYLIIFLGMITITGMTFIVIINSFNDNYALAYEKYGNVSLCQVIGGCDNTPIHPAIKIMIIMALFVIVLLSIYLKEIKEVRE